MFQSELRSVEVKRRARHPCNGHYRLDQSRHVVATRSVSLHGSLTRRGGESLGKRALNPVWGNYSNAGSRVVRSPSRLPWLIEFLLGSVDTSSMTLEKGREQVDWKRLLAYITGSVDQHLMLRNEYLVAENTILRNQITGRLRLTDGERTTLAELGQRLRKKVLAEIATVVKPETILAWHRTLIARKFDGSNEKDDHLTICPGSQPGFCRGCNGRADFRSPKCDRRCGSGVHCQYIACEFWLIQWYSSDSFR